MSWLARFAAVDRRALISSLLVAAAAFAGLAMLVDRLTGLARAAPLAEKSWSVPVAQQLVLKGVVAGPVLGIEAGAGDGVTLQARRPRLDDGSRPDRLIWLGARGDGETAGDHRIAIQLSALPGGRGGGSVVLRRSGEAVAPQLQVSSDDLALRVEAAVAIGQSLVMPSMTLLADGRELAPEGLGVGFTLPPGSTLSIELPAFPDGTAAGATILAGAAEEEGQRLRLSEVVVTGESGSPTLRSACAADAGSYAFAAFFRLDFSPAPSGPDCAGGFLAATALAVSPEGLAIDLAGSAYELVAGKPTASLWSFAMGNPVLEQAINDGLPVLVGGIFGLVSFRKRSRRGPRRKPAARPRKRRAAPRELGEQRA